MLKQILSIFILLNLCMYAHSSAYSSTSTPHPPSTYDDALPSSIYAMRPLNLESSQDVKEFFDKAVLIVRESSDKINDINENGYTLLQQALINQAYVEEVFSQLENTNGSEEDILDTNLTTIKMLLNNGADPNILFPAEQGRFKKTEKRHLLIRATEGTALPHFPLHIIELLFKYGLNAQVRDLNGNTALMKLIPLLNFWRKMSLSEYREKFIQLLIDHTTDFNAQNNRGDMVLHLTSQYADLETARLLLRNPVRLDISNSQGYTPEQVLKKSTWPSEKSSAKWNWVFSLSLFEQKVYKMLQLLEEAKNGLPANKDNLLGSSNKREVGTGLFSACARAFNSMKRAD